MTIQNAQPLSDRIKEILKALSNVAAKRKKMTSYKKAQVVVTIRIRIHTAGYKNY
jgi:hypothetical protein